MTLVPVCDRCNEPAVAASRNGGAPNFYEWPTAHIVTKEDHLRLILVSGTHDLCMKHIRESVLAIIGDRLMDDPGWVAKLKEARLI